MSATTASTTPTTASRRIELRDALARILQDRVLPYVSLIGDGMDPEPDLYHADACDAAEELVETLALAGWEIRRAGS